MVSPGPKDIENLMRFARLLNVSDEAAVERTAEALRSVLPRIQEAVPRRGRVALLEAIWESREESSISSAGLPQFLTGLTPLQRAGAFLHYLEGFTPEEIEDVCGLYPQELKDLLTRCPTDDEARQALQAMPIPPQRTEQLATLAEKAIRNPISAFQLWSPVGLAILLAAGVLLWVVLRPGQIENPALGREFLDRAENIAAENLEPVDVPAGELADWLLLKHGLENVHIPEVFAPLQAAFCGVGRIEEHSVAEIVLKESRTILFLFPAADFELTDGNVGEWRYFAQDEWVGAFQVEKGEARVVALRGEKKELQQFLGSLNVQN